MFVIAFVCTLLVATLPTLDWLIMHGAVYFNWKTAGLWSRLFQNFKTEFQMKANQSPNRIKYNSLKKRRAYNFFLWTRIVLCSIHEFFDYFRSARFYLYFLTGSCGLFRFNFFQRLFIKWKKQRVWKKSFLMPGRTENTTNSTFKYSTRVDGWLIRKVAVEFLEITSRAPFSTWALESRIAVLLGGCIEFRSSLSNVWLHKMMNLKLPPVVESTQSVGLFWDCGKTFDRPW